MPDDTRKVSTLDDLTPDEENANRGTERGREIVHESLRQLGGGRSILVDKAGRIVAGNKTAEAAKKIGMPVEVIHTDGSKLVVVQRDDLDLSDRTGTARRLAYADNRASEVGLDWDASRVAADVAGGIDIACFGFGPADLAAITRDAGRVQGAAPDSVPAPRATSIVAGDIFALGDHRLVCGDCASADVVAALMVDERAQLCCTDPPYGVSYLGGKNQMHGGKRWAAIENDERKGDDLRAWLGDALRVWLPHILDDAAFYFWTAPMFEGAAAAQAIRDVGLHIQSEIIWNKNQLVLGRADYQWKHENAWYAFKKGAQHRWFGGRQQTTVWDVDRVPAASYEHPMQKPVELYARAIENHTLIDEVCFDPFVGSGTQIIACEQLRRRCRAIEIAPTYCQVAIDRWEHFTGRKAEKIGAVTTR